MKADLTIRSHLRDYGVHFVEDLAVPLRELADGNAFFVIDALVWRIYAPALQAAVGSDRLLTVEAAETNKTLDKVREIIETLVDRRVRRGDRLVAVGGGIIQDVTAFAASITYRGIEWSFLPTTLLAQADSCIGSKTSINLGDRKNLVGNFYPPSDIYIDTGFLESLSVDDIKSGIGEILHYYIYANDDALDDLLRDYATLIRDRRLLSTHIRRSLEIKRSVIEADEFDRGERNKFNYGHTFGHALESVTGYAVKHGQAVTVGMDLANYMSATLGLMSDERFRDLHRRLSVNFPEYDLATIDLEAYFMALSKDKKNVGDNVGCILAQDVGILLKRQLPMDDIFRETIRRYFLEFSPGKDRDVRHAGRQ